MQSEAHDDQSERFADFSLCAVLVALQRAAPVENCQPPVVRTARAGTASAVRIVSVQLCYQPIPVWNAWPNQAVPL